jgi:hypothetical protein
VAPAKPQRARTLVAASPCRTIANSNHSTLHSLHVVFRICLGTLAAASPYSGGCRLVFGFALGLVCGQWLFLHALLQYPMLVHAEHVLVALSGQPGRAQPALLAPALEPEHAVPVVVPLSAAESATGCGATSGCGEIDMAETSSKSSLTARWSLSRSSRASTCTLISAARARMRPVRLWRLRICA